ncbi:MAG: T9SS type A sorting domain-containing protein, partial [Sphingobacteriales bacterium]
SYVTVNNLPDVISKIAAAGGDSLYYQVNAPGAYTFQQHSTDPTTLGLIAQGNWDFVVLQEQSQRPAFEDAQVAAEVYPYARKLDSLVKASSGECARVMFYMTWGRKNGDASNCAVWPPVCTYEGMDSLLQLRYTNMADSNNAFISPVAKVWRNLRDNAPGIELYQVDESHPTAAGTYAAAMSFYTMFFDKKPTAIPYNYTLSSATANTIKAAAYTEVYNLRGQWKQYSLWPHVDSIITTNEGGLTFRNDAISPQNVISYEWNFGDGSPLSYQAVATHTYADSGSYTVCLTVHGFCGSMTICQQISVNVTGINEQNLIPGIAVYPNPADDYIRVDGLKEKAAYAICDISGARIQTGSVTPGSNSIGLRNLAAGLYFLHLNNDKGQTLITKIVRQ